MPTTQFRYLVPTQPQVGQHDFERTARLLHTRSGIVLGAHKQDMVARTLDNRLTKLGIGSAGEYLSFLEQNPQSPEWDHFINAFTINHTAFFREQHHFDILSEFVRTRTSAVAIWCAAASTGIFIARTGRR